jgi:hypothetical protein
MEPAMTAQAKTLPKQRQATEQQKQEVARTLEKELSLLADERRERAERLGLKIELH